MLCSGLGVIYMFFLYANQYAFSYLSLYVILQGTPAHASAAENCFAVVLLEAESF